MLHIVPHTDGCLLSVRASPGAKRNCLSGIHDGALKVSVTAPPDKGRANEAIVEVLADALKIAKSNIQIVSGQTSRQKKFLIVGVPDSQLKEQIEDCLGK
ncbi:MAG: YggU family protein [Pirellulaceae bacterium]|nr:YggU family protein [Pirellulaceae bacterium]